MNEQIPDKGTLLLVDDEPMAVENLAHALSKSGYLVTSCTSGPGGIKALEHKRFDVVLTDLRMERADGMAILQRALEIDPDTVVVIITGYATLDSAVQAIKAGAYYYITKPFRLEEVRKIVANAMEGVRLKRENRQLRDQVNKIQPGAHIITQDAIMQRLLDTATPYNIHAFQYRAKNNDRWRAGIKLADSHDDTVSLFLYLSPQIGIIIEVRACFYPEFEICFRVSAGK